MRHNNFDIVRLILASMVLLIHSYDLSGCSSLAIFVRLFSPRIAVEGFFTISGFLIFASYERCASIKEYLFNRAWRILPAYWVATALCLGIAFYTGHFNVWKFLLSNLVFANFLQPGIGGVFEHNPMHGMNGALWTLKIEVMFYLVVPLIWRMFRTLGRDTVLWSLFFLSLVYRALLWKHEKLSIQLPGQLSFFVIGALVYYHLDSFKKYRVPILTFATFLYVLHLCTGWFFPRPAAVAALTLGACLLLPAVKGPTARGDFSYGIYIFHWPVFQLFVAAGLFYTHTILAFLLSVGTIICCAVMSWFLIEKPSLAHSRSLRVRQV